MKNFFGRDVDIVIVNQYLPEPNSSGITRHFVMRDALQNAGYRVQLIGAKNHHKRVGNTEVGYVDRIPTLIYRDSNSLIRIINWFIFMIILPCYLIRYLNSRYILYSSLSLIGGLSAILFAKLFRKKFIFEVRDIWPESGLELGAFSKKSIVYRFLRFVEIRMLKNSDLIISSLPGFGEYLNALNTDYHKKFRFVGSIAEDSEVNKYKNKMHEKLKIGYFGGMGPANNLQILFEAAVELPFSVELVVAGSGINYENFMKLYNAQDNITFCGNLSINEINNLYDSVDICYYGAQNKQLYKYGVSPVKLVDITRRSIPLIVGADFEIEKHYPKLKHLKVGTKNKAELCRLLVSLYSDKSKLEELSHISADLFQTHFSAQDNISGLLSELRDME